MIAAALSSVGARVTSALSFDWAIACIEESPPDVIVSDIAMPGHDGYELIQRLRALHQAPFIPAIAITAYARDEDRERALASGFQAYLPKPIELAELITILARFSGVVDPANVRAPILQTLSDYSRESEKNL
jgi:CheY-like chemotaxis protein